MTAPNTTKAQGGAEDQAELVKIRDIFHKLIIYFARVSLNDDFYMPLLESWAKENLPTLEQLRASASGTGEGVFLPIFGIYLGGVRYRLLRKKIDQAKDSALSLHPVLEVMVSNQAVLGSTSSRYHIFGAPRPFLRCVGRFLDDEDARLENDNGIEGDPLDNEAFLEEHSRLQAKRPQSSKL